MNAKKLAIALLCLAACLIASPGAQAASAPAWDIAAVPLPTNFSPGTEGSTFGGPLYFVTATNVGGAATTGPITLKAELPEGIKPGEAEGLDVDSGSPDPSCTTNKATREVTCTTPGPLQAGQWVGTRIPVDVSAPVGKTLALKASISGGGTSSATTTAPTLISNEPAPFGFLQGPTGFSLPIVESDGQPTTQAGSHPYELIANTAFPVGKPGNVLSGTAHLHDLVIELAQGLSGNPAATSELCTEAELTSDEECPLSTQVGIVTAMTVVGGPVYIISPVFNMVPPPGEAASLGFNALGVGVYVHALGSVRSDGDYGISVAVNSTLARPNSPVLGAQTQTWGDPTAPSHDRIRGACNKSTESCSVTHQETAFLTMPSHCSGPTTSNARVDTWEEPGNFTPASYSSASLAGNPAGVEGCSKLEYNPTLKVQPTTGLTDSPSGLDFALQQPQKLDLKHLYTAALKDLTLTLPPGMAVNAASADGQGVCSGAQVGLKSAAGQTPVRFTDQPNSCPDAAKLGTVQVLTPLLAQLDPLTNKVLHDVKGNAVPRLLQGSVYLAKPFENPFGSLIAIYVTIDDPISGTFAKLAGRVEPDPATGQLTTRFVENPELPVQEIKAHFFAGPRAPLITPPFCATHTTNAELTPWSAPEAPSLAREDSFETTAGPDGGACPASEAEAPNSPQLTAGTLSPLAGSYSPMVLRLSRADGTQRLAGLDVTLPTGLSAKLAGVAQCSEAQIAAAIARSNPNEGALEQAAPSCPAASQVGTVQVGAGAGPSPLYVQGNVYLAGPYKGAPLSFVFITPAVAGPFDLGVVVVRSPIYVDPTTAQARAVSDPFPRILDGIPLDLRSAVVRVDRPQFTLNPTSCEPKSFSALATSALGAVASLSERFQVGGCSALPYKPKLNTRLFGPIHRGGHPRLRSVFQAKPGEAGTARISFALPHSEFIDQAHFRTICTRVQFTADQCPAGSIYGHVKATTPLFDYPLQGPVYLRSSNNELPDTVLALRGPPSQPIEVDLAGRVDSVNGGLRITFDSVPDAPVTKAIVTTQGGKKGLFQNSTNICQGTHRVTLKLDAQNGKFHDANPTLKADCGSGKGQKGRGSRH